MYSLSGDIIHTNVCGVDTLGFTPEECRMPMEVRSSRLHAKTSDGRPFPLHEVPPRLAMMGEVMRNVEVIVYRPEGMRWLLVSAAPVRIGERIIGAVAIFTDITALQAGRGSTARKRAESRALAGRGSCRQLDVGHRA